MLKTKNAKRKRGLLLSGIVAATAALLTPGAVSAWGPDRPTYEITDDGSTLPTHAVFNSITNNAGIGDEREFLRIRNINTGEDFTSASGAKYYIEPGSEYEVVMYYHNDASSSYNYEEYGNVGVALEAQLRAEFPGKISASNEGDLKSWLDYKYKTEAEGEYKNNQVYDTLTLSTTSNQDITLRYVLGSAKLYNDYRDPEGIDPGYQEGVGISAERLFSNVAYNGTTPAGALLGYSSSYGLDGMLPSCNEYSGRIVFTIHAEQPSAKLDKSASLDGKNFYKTVNANPGDTITYKIEFANTGSTTLNNVTFRDQLPDGVELIPGSTILYNLAAQEGAVMQDVVNGNGFITGSYEPGATFTLYYKVKVKTAEKIACGTFNYINTAKVVYEGSDSEITDTSTIEVKIDDSKCVPSELPHTGPAEIALTFVAIACVTVGGAYWLRSQKDLEAAKATQAASKIESENNEANKE